MKNLRSKHENSTREYLYIYNLVMIEYIVGLLQARDQYKAMGAIVEGPNRREQKDPMEE